jgi:hypothetical protein
MSHRVENPASPVILLLAAGESLRFGDIKQLVEIQGEPMVRRAARSALEQDVPVVVVTGAYAEQVEAVLDDLPLRLIRFDGWQRVWAARSPLAFVTWMSNIRKLLRYSCVWPINRSWIRRCYGICSSDMR